ncbi:MAG: DNA repair protein RadA [Candidatus Chisholmbacteria bacterium]|nr:DNA repair protein RadA [Candidatus Chisholmbacteria bacterium]
MGKRESVFVCQQCGEDFPKWSGRCPSCSSWNSLVETTVFTRSVKRKTKTRLAARQGEKQLARPIRLSEVKGGEGYKNRIPTGIGELDRVLGGGMVAGSAVLVAGEPGIGKSTLLTQLALSLAGSRERVASSKRKLQAASHEPQAVLYVCGEESPEQVKLRVERLEVATSNKRQATRDNLLLLAETDVDEVIAQIEKLKAQNLGLVIADSVQALATQDLAGMAGSVGQVRETSFRLMAVTKNLGIPLFLVGHVTKEGAIAGPKVLEHMVDVVVELQGEREHEFRVLRCSKNRFGATEEVGVFMMTEEGMEEVKNPSDVFLEERQVGVPGSVVVATLSGLRPILIEVQALVVPTQLAILRRVSTGIDQRKVQLLVAVLQKRCRLNLGMSDVLVNVVGGLKVTEPAVDLGVAMAIASSFINKPIPAGRVVIGEVGLLGEIRQVRRFKQRVEEAYRMGYKKVMGPDKFRTLVEVLRVLK